MEPLDAQKRAALARIAVTTDPIKLRNFIDNARLKKEPEVERAAFMRLCFVQPEATPGTVEHDVWQSIHALEEMKAAARGKTTRLTRTRQKIGRDGEAKTVADLTLKPAASPGFLDLIALGHPELTFEAVALRHPKTFSESVQITARSRLANANVDIASLLASPKGT